VAVGERFGGFVRKNEKEGHLRLTFLSPRKEVMTGVIILALTLFIEVLFVK